MCTGHERKKVLPTRLISFHMLHRCTSLFLSTCNNKIENNSLLMMMMPKMTTPTNIMTTMMMAMMRGER